MKDTEDDSAPRAAPDESKLSLDSLREAALSYLDRYDASVSQLRAVLRRRVAKYGGESVVEEAHERVEEVLQRFEASALIDDSRFARGFAEAARLRGASSQKIREKLRARGIDGRVIDETLRKLGETDGLDDLAAAIAYAKKKRLNAKISGDDPAAQRKALASLARQGFSFEVAQRALALV